MRIEILGNPPEDDDYEDAMCWMRPAEYRYLGRDEQTIHYTGSGCL